MTAIPSGAADAPISADSQTIELTSSGFPELRKLPVTPLELFSSLAISINHRINKAPTSHDYILPWAGFTSWRDARIRLEHFESANEERIVWRPFNDNSSNDGPMSLNAYSGRALIERVTNAGDANLERMAISYANAMPSSPKEAVAIWFGLGQGALVSELGIKKVQDLARSTVTVRGFIGSNAEENNAIFDTRDFGVGLSGDEMPETILSLNRGNKKMKPWLTGKHGQGASSTFQYSDLTLIASRKLGSPKVAFTLIEKSWDKTGGMVARTPTFRYLTLDGNVPEFDFPEEDFKAGTLVRHIGYVASNFSHIFGENSLYGLLMRSLAEPLFPIWLEMISLDSSKSKGVEIHPGFRRFGRVIRGSVNALERARAKAQLHLPDEGEVEQTEDEMSKILHRASEYCKLPRFNYGGREGEGEIGQVRINYWVIDPAGRTPRDTVKHFVDPEKNILMTLDGQTHAEESRAIIGGSTGAGLWAVAKYMVVQIDCNDLDPRAKYELFTSTREHAKETPIKKYILEELVRRVTLDERLQELNTHLAAADIKRPTDDKETISSLIRQYLKSAGVNFDHITHKVRKLIEAEESRPGKNSKSELPPIASVDPPTFVRWKFQGDKIKLSPGQRYSYFFETDAAPHYWDMSDPSNSKIKVLAQGINYTGSGEMKGGRVRCHFACPSEARVGTKGMIQVQLDFAPGQAITRQVPVEIVEKPIQKTSPETKKPNEKTEEEGRNGSEIKVRVQKRDFSQVEIPIVQPIPLTRTDNTWLTLDWGADPERVGFSIRSIGGKIHLYYNAEFPPFLELKRKMSKKSLEDEFVRRYQIKLVLHTIFSVNYDFLDEDLFPTDTKKSIRDLFCATAESLALATKSELEIEGKLKKDDTAPLETVVGADLQSALS